MSAAELAHSLIEPFRLLEVAHVSAVRKHDEPGIGDCFLEHARDT
jgi:hypothetical protein